ncbi:MAG: DUF4368 domain-containing protein [Oscillospiraceae bacterium]|nr:DUF4368 domain-containing protein [Oscillospiraceae bacterium]
MELIDCIEVSERIAEDGKKRQEISVKYNFIGNVAETSEITSIGA